MKRILLSSVAVFAFAAIGHADELSDIRALSKQLREQNQALTKRLADLEKRQQRLEQQPVQAAARVANPGDAKAADLPYKTAVKAAAPVNDDICWHGVCVYGNFDMGFQYQQHGAPINALSVPNDNTPAKNGNAAYSGVTANMMSNSYLGLRGKQEIADDLYGVFNLQSTFNPNSGMGSNGTGSVVQNNGLALAMTNAYGDSPKAGQLFNSAAYFGLSSPTYGTLTAGRQLALSSELLNGYDPLSGSNSWSVIANGSIGGGGSTENKFYDNSYKYRVNVGPARFYVQGQWANGGNSGTGNAIQGGGGFDYMGLSMDFLGGKIKDSVLASPLTSTQVIAMNASGINTGSGAVAATIADNTIFQVGAKYTFEHWTVFSGYEWYGSVNPSNPLQSGAFIQGGYTVFAPNNTNFTTERINQVEWIGVKYLATPDLDLTTAYYHQSQNSFVNAANPTGTCSNVSASSCSGSLDGVSLVADWRFARHFDVFAGMMWSQVTNGLASGYLQTNPAGNGAYVPGVSTNKAKNFNPGVGMRYQF